MPTSVELPVDGAFARRLREFGPLGITAFIVVALVGPVPQNLVGGLLVLLWRNASHTPWRAIGYVRPANWFRTVTGGVAFGILFKLAMKVLVMPLFGAPPINSAYHYLVGNLAAVAAMAIYVIVAGGFSEETLYRGFLFHRGIRVDTWRRRSTASRETRTWWRAARLSAAFGSRWLMSSTLSPTA